MAFDKRHSVTIIATAAIAANRFVESDGTHAASSDDVVGVSETPAAVGRGVSLVTWYSYEVQASEPIADGDWIKPASDGSGRAAVSDRASACGRAKGSAAVGGLVEVVLSVGARAGLAPSKAAVADSLVSGALIPSATYDAVIGAQNSATLQALLDRGGLAPVVLPGVYPLATQLRLKQSDTTIRLADGVELMAAPGMELLLDTQLILDTGVTVTLSNVTTQSLRATIAWTNHGLTTRDAVWLQGATEYHLNGVFPVIAVNNANSVDIQLRRLPPTNGSNGTITAKKALQRIVIEGGIWNYNSAGGNDGIGWRKHCIRLGGISDLKVSGLRGKDTKKYLLCVGNCRLVEIVGSMGPQLASDNIKVYASNDVRVIGTGAYTSDDQISLQTNEPAIYATSRWCYGDVLHATVERAGGVTGIGGIALYPNEGGLMDAITLRDAGLSQLDASVSASITIDFQTVAGALGTVNIDSPYIAGQKNAIVIQAGQGGTGGNWESINISGPAHKSFNNAGRFLSVGAGAFNGTINVFGGYLAGGEGIINTSSTGAVTLNLNDVRGGTLFYPFRVNGVGGTLRINGRLTLDNTPNNSFLSVPAGSSPTIYLGLDQCNTPANPVFSIGGTPTIYPIRPGVKVDLAVCARSDGAIAYNTNAALGTLGAAGLVVGQGTAANSWRLMGDTTLRY